MNEIKEWDMEYSTSFLDEMLFLKRNGIRYTWVYTNRFGITVWKFKKEKKLWDTLSKMYSDKKYEIKGV